MNAERYMKVAAAVQIKSSTTMMRKKKIKLLPRHQWIIYFRKVDKVESSKEPEAVPSASGVREIAARPLSSVAGSPSALPSPTSSLSSSQ